MNKNQKEALLTYLDSQMMSFCKGVEQYVDPDAVGTFYDRAYDLLSDMEEAIASQMLIAAVEHQPALTLKRKSQ